MSATPLSPAIAVVKASGSNPEQLVSISSAIVASMTGNAAYTTPSPSLASITAKTASLSAAVAATNAAKTAWKGAANAQSILKKELNVMLQNLRNYVQDTSAGDGPTIQTAGMQVKSEPTPKSVPVQVTALEIVPAGNGRLNLRWKKVTGAVSYRIQMSTVAGGLTGYSDIKISTNSRENLLDSTNGISAGEGYWFRIIAVNSKGDGAASDPTQVFVG